MKRLLLPILLILLTSLIAVQTVSAQCYELGTPVGQLTPLLKSVAPGICGTVPTPGPICDCPPGYVAVGYEGYSGYAWGPDVLSSFKLRCKELNSNGTLGAAVVVTCSNGSAVATPVGPVDAAVNQAIVGFEVRIGCAIDAIRGASKPMSQILAGDPNTNNTLMPIMGGTGGSGQPFNYAPNGSVIIGMQTYNGEPAGVSGGVAWRYAPVVACAVQCSMTAISVSNISTCNDQGTPDPNDDTFTANVTVFFSGAPTTGTLNLSGDGTASVAASALGQGSYTFTGVTMSADGGSISLTASFSANPSCSFTENNAGTAPQACSVAPPACSINSITVSNISNCNSHGTSTDPADDTFTASVTVTFNGAPSTGNLVLSGSGSALIPVASLGTGTHTFTGVTMSANGGVISLTASFSASPSCTFTNSSAGIAPPPCSTGAQTIPTMSEWGLILFALIIFTLSVVFGMQHQRSLAMGEAPASISFRRRRSFDRQLFLKVLPLVYLGIVAIFAGAISLSGYELTQADIPGSLMAGAIIAFLVQYVIRNSGRASED